MPATFPCFFPPKPNRVHEVCGAGAAFFAFALAERLGGNIMWVQQDWQASQIDPQGFSAIVSPDRLLTVSAKNQIETLAVAEEALRSGAVRLLVMELGKPLGLTAGRRLQLSAEAGKSIGLCLIQEGMGSNAAESRWRCRPLYDARTTPGDSTLQQWEIIKNKSGTFGSWHVRWDVTARRLHVVPPAGERPGSEGASG